MVGQSDFQRGIPGPGVYLAADGSKPPVTTSMRSVLSDDFGGTALDLTKWDVIQGGLRSGTKVGDQTGKQNIGTGTTGITYSVSSSNLAVNMGTTNGAELWFLSKQVFAGKEDILAVLTKSQPIAANSIFIGLVEVDPESCLPLLNANFAAEFPNRGGCEFGLTTTSTAFQAEAIGDSSAAKATGAVGVAGSALTTAQEYLIEVDARDVIVSNSPVDSVAAKASGGSRVSTQCPNDGKAYKLLMRFKNVSAPGSATTVTIGRILVVNNFENRVQISGGEGDTVANKAVAVNITNTPNMTVSAGLPISPSTSVGPTTTNRVTSAATTNATSIKASAGVLLGGYIRNRHATLERWVKFYNKASAPTVGTDIPVLTLGVKAGERIELAAVLGAAGMRFSTGIAMAITGAYADSDTTAVVASDVDVQTLYA